MIDQKELTSLVLSFCRLQALHYIVIGWQQYLVYMLNHSSPRAPFVVKHFPTLVALQKDQQYSFPNKLSSASYFHNFSVHGKPVKVTMILLMHVTCRTFWGHQLLSEESSDLDLFLV
jgi:hypothetical protein